MSEGCIRSHGNYRQHCQHSNHQQFINLRHKPSQTTITDDEATFDDKKASIWLSCNALVGSHKCVKFDIFGGWVIEKKKGGSCLV